MNLSSSFVAASSSRHPLSAPEVRHNLAQAVRPGYPTPPNPYRHSERSRPIFSFAFAPAKASACECEESLRATPSPRAFLQAMNLSPSFVAASSSRHPLSAPEVRHNLAQAVRPGYRAPPNPNLSFRTEQADFFFPFTSCEGSACGCEESLPVLCSGEFISPSAVAAGLQPG